MATLATHVGNNNNYDCTTLSLLTSLSQKIWLHSVLPIGCSFELSDNSSENEPIEPRYLVYIPMFANLSDSESS